MCLHWCVCVCMCVCMMIPVRFFAYTVCRGRGLQWRAPCMSSGGSNCICTALLHQSPLWLPAPSDSNRGFNTGSYSSLALHLSSSDCDLSGDLLLRSLCKSSLKRNLFEQPGINACNVHPTHMYEYDRQWPLDLWWLTQSRPKEDSNVVFTLEFNLDCGWNAWNDKLKALKHTKSNQL